MFWVVLKDEFPCYNFESMFFFYQTPRASICSFGHGYHTVTSTADSAAQEENATKTEYTIYKTVGHFSVTVQSACCSEL